MASQASRTTPLSSSSAATASPGIGAFETSTTVPPRSRNRESATLAASNARLPSCTTPQMSQNSTS